MKCGVSQVFPCSYLPGEQEQLLVALPPSLHTAMQYQQLLEMGFRRSGEQLYRPHCPYCSACQSLRINARQFRPSRSQKRILKRNAHLTWHFSEQANPQHYQLYCDYIHARHHQGGMYPPDKKQYQSFLCDSLPVSGFIEVFDKQQLIAVAIIDVLPNCLSALYSFFSPQHAHLSLGIYMILLQLSLAEQWHKDHVYLGYQIDGSDKMAYKQHFYPHQRFIDNRWHLYSKKVG